MHRAILSTGVLSIGVAIYLLLGVVYPFVSPIEDSTFGSLPLMFGALLFGAFGSYLCWESIVRLEDKNVGKKISRKRKRKFALA